MNLSEALNAALPELPTRKTFSGYPKVDPSAVIRENMEDGGPIVVVLIRNTDKMFRFPPEQWKLIELFDGKRSYEEVAARHAELYGVAYGIDDLREFTSGLEDLDFWYKTPLERSIALRQKLESSRHQHTHRRSKWGDIAHMQFSAWDPDQYFNRIYPYAKWIYSRWFTALTLTLFACMLLLSASNWQQIRGDTVQFYNFMEKSTSDLVEFWFIFLILGFFHESAHGLTCKHYGAEVHGMGFHLIYLTPAFFVDVSEAWVYASRWQRLVTIMAGVWVEMIFCSIATIVWWGTPPGSGAHDFAYKIMLLTGAAVVIVNMNPLIKLDGYYAFSEIIGFPDIKEKSTAYLSGLVRQRIFRIPVDMEYVPKKRRPGYLLYAILSGIYSYGLLYAVVRFSYKIFLSYSPQWAFVPVLALAMFIFRSRIGTLQRFMRTVYLDKKDRMRSWVTAPRITAAAAVFLLILFAPIWHETVTARFILEPGRREVVRAMVPGRVTAVFVREGQMVNAGEPLAQMENSAVQSLRTAAEQDYALTGFESVQAELQHGDQSTLLPQHARAVVDRGIAEDETKQLRLRASISGILMTPRLNNLTASYLDAGSTVAEIGDVSRMNARIFVLEYIVPRVKSGAPVNLLRDGGFASIHASVNDLQSAPEILDPALDTDQKVQGIGELKYYVADALIPNDGSLRDGMTGTAKIAVGRRSIAGFAYKEIGEFIHRKLW